MVSILTVTGKQFGNILNFYGKVEKEKIDTPQQLEFFLVLLLSIKLHQNMPLP